MKANTKARHAARQLFRMCRVDGLLDAERVRWVTERVATSRRRGSLAVLSDFHRLVRLDRDRRTALVESATALTDGLRQGVEADLTHLYGHGIAMQFEQNPALIGGMRIKVGSDVYDGSVRARLAELSARL